MIATPIVSVHSRVCHLPPCPVQRSTVLIAHLGSSAIAVLCFLLLGSSWISRSLAVAASVTFMQLFACMHPPGGCLNVAIGFLQLETDIGPSILPVA